MNFCMKCQSLYAQPGTCNCYAQIAKPIALPAPLPYYPPVTYPSPWWGIQPPRPFVPYVGDVVPSGITTTGVAITGSTVSLEQAMRSASGWSYTATVPS